jgi:predicted P-loop ATPase
VVILLAREVSEDEYPALMRMVAKQIGLDYFDDSTYQANRMMYWASCPSDGDFVFDEKSGEPLDPDQYLNMYDDWRDVTQWPTSSRESEVQKREVTKQQDPLSKGGAVGAFCSAYSVEDVFAEFLSDIYEPAAIEGRYQYKEADSTAGVVVYDGRWAYSHHTSDPACGKLLNAFDLVRIHKFGDLDDRASFKAMAEFAVNDERVKEELAALRRKQASDDFADAPKADDWEKRLTVMKDGSVEETLENLVLIFENDPDFTSLGYNEFKRRLEFTSPPPWNSFAFPSLIDSDISEIRVRISRRYGLYSPTKTQDAMTRVAARRGFHPVRDFLDSLPPWDKKPRAETLLVKYLGAEDTKYTRTVTRKILCAAVARIYLPGVKFDHVLVMDGMQGKGKSTLFNVLAGDDWYNDSLSLTDMQDKAGAEKLQGYWINEIGELAGMRKVDIDKVKAFTSRKDDIYRPSYGRVVESHPRQCVIVATVNGDNRGYLRDTTGNRRFWPVKCPGSETSKPWDITEEERLQIWAEAKFLWDGGEKLYLDQEITAVAAEMQLEAMETDPREGMVEEFLCGLVPEGWNGYDRERRSAFYCDDLTEKVPEGSVLRESITIIEIWVECFGNGASKAKRQDSNEIAAILRKLGWEPNGQIIRVSDYGKQNLWTQSKPNCL